MNLLLTALDWNFVLVTSMLASITAQIIKVIINLVIFGRFIPERMWGAGGMPSSHSATVCALASSSAAVYGPGSGQFAIAAIVAFIVMYDACNVRLETGKQAIAIKELQELFRNMGEDLSAEEKLKELVGHTLPQVLAGALLGILIGTAAVWV